MWSVPGEIRDQVIALELLESGEKESDSTLIDDDGVSDRKRKLDAELVEESQKAIPVEVIEEKHDDVKEEAVTESGAVVSEEPPTKRKKVKKQIVRSIEELETDEDWQRSVAAQMAEEVAEAEKLAVKPEVVDMEPVPALKVNISSDEGIALFKVSHILLDSAVYLTSFYRRCCWRKILSHLLLGMMNYQSLLTILATMVSLTFFLCVIMALLTN